MKYVWRHIPLFRFLIPVMLGILLASSFSFILPFVLGLSIVLAISSIGLHFYSRSRINRRVITVNSWLVFVILIGAGFLLQISNNQLRSKNHFSKHKSAKGYVIKISSNPLVKPKSISAEVVVLEAFDSINSKKCIGKAQLFFALDSHSRQLKYGDVLLIANTLQTIAKPSNPHQFDFSKYYQAKNIFHNGYVAANDWRQLPYNKGNVLFTFAYKTQNVLQAKFKHFFKDEAVRGVAQAIVFGYKEELDEEWLEAFSKTGTIHVLAVSGLHVGIIYVLLAFAIRLKQSKGKGLAIKTLIILAILFGYSLITGFSPSVSRASIMFGLVLVSSVFAQKTSIYNTLSFACLVLLIANPNNLFNVGFQFSFLAVFGIVFYKDRFRRILPTSNWLLDKIITLMAVSIAAQITTFPLGLYYFHQYPNLFVFSNLLVIPCITIILYGGIFFVAASFFSTLAASALASMVSAYIAFISATVLYIQDLPFAFFENVYVSFWQMVLIYITLFFITFVWINRWKAGLVIPIICVALFMLAEIYEIEKTNKAEVISFYHTKETLLVFRDNNQATFFASSGIYTDESASEFIITPYLVNENITKHDVLPIETLKRPFSNQVVTSYGNGSVWFNNTSYLVLDGVKEYITDTLHTDYLLIGSKKSTKYLAAVAPLIQAKKVVICSNVRKYVQNTIFSEKKFSQNPSTFIQENSRYIKL